VDRLSLLSGVDVVSDGEYEAIKIQLAVICERLDTVIARLDDLCRQQSSDHERITAMESHNMRMDDHLSSWQAGQATLTLLAAAIAAWIGTRH